MQARRTKQVDDGAPGDFLDCDTCLGEYPLETRRCFHCGWLREDEWLTGDRPFPEASVCPGYSTRLPEVAEAARALSWSKRGGLAPVYGVRKLPQVAIDAIDIIEVARSEVEAKHYRELRREREG